MVIPKIERNASMLLNVCKDVSLAVTTGKTKYMEVGRQKVRWQMSVSR
jgi:hypothetical protein